MIEILYFGLGSNRGGIETYLYKIAQKLDFNTFHLNYIDMTGEDNTPCFYKELSLLGCFFYKVTPRKKSVKRNYFEIKELFANHHFDILHYNVNSLSYILPVTQALKHNCSVIVHSRSTNIPNKRILTKITHELNKQRLAHLNIKRIAVTYDAGKWLFGDSKYDVYHNGVDTEKYRFSQENRRLIRKQLKCEGKTVIGNVGAFVPAKNHRFMVNVFEVYSKRNPDAVLWFIGDGASRSSIELLVEEKGLQNKVLFLGVREDMQELYAGMDLFLFPSIYEGYGNVLLEAECEGVPCLTSDCIPQDACVAENVFSFSLHKTMDEWADMIDFALKAQINEKENYHRIMDEKGVSVESEISRLENLYVSIYERNNV